MDDRDKMLRKARKSGEEEHWEAYKRLRNECNNNKNANVNIIKTLEKKTIHILRNFGKSCASVRQGVSDYFCSLARRGELLMFSGARFALFTITQMRCWEIQNRAKEHSKEA